MPALYVLNSVQAYARKYKDLRVYYLVRHKQKSVQSLKRAHHIPVPATATAVRCVTQGGNQGRSGVHNMYCLIALLSGM